MSEAKCLNCLLTERLHIKDNITNGDVIKALFHVKNVEEMGCCTFVSIAGDSDMRVYKDWWNAPYKEG